MSKQLGVRGSYQIDNLGPDHEQYFQGAGVSFTKYDDVAVGIGDNAVEAYQDAVEILFQDARSDVRNTFLLKLPRRPRGITARQRLTAAQSRNGEFHWYVAVYVKWPRPPYRRGNKLKVFGQKVRRRKTKARRR